MVQMVHLFLMERILGARDGWAGPGGLPGVASGDSVFGDRGAGREAGELEIGSPRRVGIAGTGLGRGSPGCSSPESGGALASALAVALDLEPGVAGCRLPGALAPGLGEDT